MKPLTDGDPAMVGGFVLRARLGAGGMGQVFLGHSPAGRAVAVKIVHPHYAQDPEFRRRFRQEVTVARAVSGAFTAPVVAAGPDDDPPWLATVYVPGPNLAEAVAAGGPLPEASLWPLLGGLVEALQAIHAVHIVHRDLKPANVLLAQDGPRVIDFGIARAVDQTALTGTGKVIGTFGFMSPEQVQGGTVEPPSDVFALGAVIAFASTGTGPFGEGGAAALMHRVISAEPQLDSVPRPLRDLVADCLRKDPDQRPTLPGLAGAIANQWAPPDHFPGPLWPAEVTRLIRSRKEPAPGIPAAMVQPNGAVTHPPTVPVTAAPQPGLTIAELARRHQEALQLGATADFAESARLMAGVAADRAQVLGPEHPHTLESRHFHAFGVWAAGDRAQAGALMAGVAAGRARVLGPDHPDTLLSSHIHAHGVFEAGDVAQAVGLMGGVAAGRARVLGPEHPSTLLSRHLHACFVGVAGDVAQAAGLMAGVAAGRARVLGPGNPDTLLSRYEHACFVGASGDRPQAAWLMAGVVGDRARVLGPDHHDTLLSRFAHACFVGETGDPAQAAWLLGGVAGDRARVQGPDHPETLESRHWHAYYVMKAGDLAQAAWLMAGVAGDRARVLGPDHPDTLQSCHWYAHCAQAAR
ncbi:protein kinase domain-containing protein [Streptomyces sp. NPDC002156]